MPGRGGWAEYLRTLIEARDNAAAFGLTFAASAIVTSCPDMEQRQEIATSLSLPSRPSVFTGNGPRIELTDDMPQSRPPTVTGTPTDARSPMTSSASRFPGVSR